MKCKKCGYEIEKGWKYCPNCSHSVYLEIKIIIILSILLVGVIGIGISIFVASRPVDEKYVKKELESKYHESFDVNYVESVANPDVELGCDGSTFGTINGKGETEYYLVYSKKEKLEFLAYYDNSKDGKIIHDNYEIYLNRRDNTLKTYELIYRYFNINIDRVSYKGNLNDIQDIESYDEFNELLSKFNLNYSKYLDYYIFLGVHMNGNTKDFVNSYYSNILKLSEEYNNMDFDREFGLGIILYFGDGYDIHIYSGNEIYVYNEVDKSKTSLLEFMGMESSTGV